MSNYPKYQLSAAIAQDGEITIPPLTSEEAGLGRLSQQIGWGRENAIPIEQGGIPPFKSDFNGVFFLLSQIFAVVSTGRDYELFRSLGLRSWERGYAEWD